MSQGRLPPPLVIGRYEYVDLPQWGIRKLRAKVDTGARTSALHVTNLQDEGGAHVWFEVVPHRDKRERRVRVRARVVRRARVRSSNGHYEMRIFVGTTLRLGSVEREVEISLVDRGRMNFRMLLGRSTLARSFLVDAGREALLGRPRRRRRTPRPVAQP